jgi:hypothetical protein
MTKAVSFVAGGIVALLLASGCSSEPPERTSPGTAAPPGTVFPSSFDTVPNLPPLLVERPEEVRDDVNMSDLPVALRLNRGMLALTEEDGHCVDTALVNYLNGAGAVYAVDSDQTVAALGGAILVCAGQDVLAGRISARVRAASPTMSDQQTDCVQEEVEVADPAALALLLGAFTYANGARVDLQQTFLTSVAKACGLPWGDAG